MNQKFSRDPVSQCQGSPLLQKPSIPLVLLLPLGKKFWSDSVVLLLHRAVFSLRSLISLRDNFLAFKEFRYQPPWEGDICQDLTSINQQSHTIQRFFLRMNLIYSIDQSWRNVYIFLCHYSHYNEKVDLRMLPQGSKSTLMVQLHG